MDNFDTCNVLELMPFIHQVGGHSFMLSLDEATVCKALIPREMQFYQTLPQAVRKFTPNFHGVIRVRIAYDHDGYAHFLSQPPANYRPRGQPKRRVKFKKSGSIEYLATDDLFSEDTSASGSGLNPWVLTCHKQHMDQFKTVEGVETVEKEEEREFIVLENLVCKFEYPCILDLKMGTRQYGDAASLAKKQSKMVKVVSTTSAKLGLRVGGMQVFQTQTQRFLCRNKFYGRSLSVPGFQQALVQFLHNGVRFRKDVLSVLIRKLEELANVLNRLDAIRFYTSSLLLMYEGDDDTNEADDGSFLPNNHDNTSQNSSLSRRGSESDLTRKNSNSDSSPLVDDVSSPNSQVKRRTSSAANLDSTAQSETSSNSSSSSTIFEDCTRSKARSDNFRGRILSTKSDPGGGSGFSAEPRVDVRLIDFAHSTHKDLDDVVVYSGPDRGFLFGVETLITMLKNIQTDYG